MYNLLIIPDTQYMAKNYPEVFMNMTKTIVKYKEKLSIDAVIQLGDIVDGGGLAKEEYNIAKTCFNLIDKEEIPLILAAGNHDYDRPIGVNLDHPTAKKDGRNLSTYNQYFGANRLENKSWYIGSYESGNFENSYYRIGEIMILVLEYGPRDEVLGWGKKIVEMHKNKKIIVITHSYMYHDGNRTSKHTEHNPIHSPETADGNDGEMIWKKFISQTSNVIAVFSGHHVPKNVSYRVDLTTQDSKVLQSFQNWQGETYGGGGRMRYIQFNEKDNTIQAKVFNPLTEEYEEGTDMDFLIDLNGE